MISPLYQAGVSYSPKVTFSNNFSINRSDADPKKIAIELMALIIPDRYIDEQEAKQFFGDDFANSIQVNFNGRDYYIGKKEVQEQYSPRIKGMTPILSLLSELEKKGLSRHEERLLWGLGYIQTDERVDNETYYFKVNPLIALATLKANGNLGKTETNMLEATERFQIEFPQLYSALSSPTKESSSLFREAISIINAYDSTFLHCTAAAGINSVLEYLADPTT